MPSDTRVTGRDIVIVGQQPWDTGIGSNCKNIALEFSRYNRVLYVNSPLDRFTLWKDRREPWVQKRLAVVNGREKSIVQISVNLWNLYPTCVVASINKLKIRSLFNSLNYRNNRLFAKSIQAAIRELGFKDIILFNDNDIFRSFYLKELLQPALSIYYSRDYMLAVDYWKFHGEKLEPELIAKSDLCVANSVYLANYCKRYNPKSYYVGQGCDLEMFRHRNSADVPADLATVRHPVIGYTGALQSIRLDIDLLEFIAQQKPAWSIVLVGPEDEVFRVSRLHNIPNIHFLGPKKPEELPAYVGAFDVCLNPQLVNQVTIGNYPRKIDEYLAMGKPVVATATETMSIFSDHVYLAGNREQYIAYILKGLADDSDTLRTARRNFAAGHTWENNVGEIYKAINDADSLIQVYR